MLLRGDDGDESSGAGGPEPVDVTSDAPRQATLEDLVTAADVVLTGEVVGTDGGRIFGDPDSDAAIESRLVTLEVAEVLVGSPVADLAGGDTVLVEEEGWTLDGAPLVVDGLAPSAVGASGFWFLQQVEAPTGPAYAVGSAQGRHPVDPAGPLHGADAIGSAWVRDRG